MTKPTASIPASRNGTRRLAPNPVRIDRQRQLVASLVRELAQTERSAELHCAKEADRLGGHGPARTLRAIAAHATAVRVELPGLAAAADARASRLGTLLGSFLSLTRSLVFDRLADHERSFRGTLIGVRHGVDLVRMLRHVTDDAGLVDISGFCTRWLAEREPLLAMLESGLAWFARHPGVAVTSRWPMFRGPTTAAKEYPVASHGPN